jgi:hypothetical protein
VSITSITLVDSDLSTVLFDLHSADGSGNSSWGSVITKFGLGGSFTVTAPHESGRFPRSGSDGAFTTFSRRGLGQASWRQFISGTTEANLRSGAGRLADLITRGCTLKIVTSAVTRYLRFEPSGYPTPFQGKDSELADLYAMFKFQQGLDVSVACQPYWEAGVQTIGPTSVPNDPASTNGRALSVSILGDLPTPVEVAAKMDTGSTVERILVAHHTIKGLRDATGLSDYQGSGGTRYMQCEATGGGWTITLGTDTTGQIVADASPGSGTSVAQTSYATVATMARRVRGTRTANLNSLRGKWDVYVRVKASAAAKHVGQLRWGPSLADPPAYSNLEFVHDTSLNGTPPAFGWVEKYAGPIYLPDEVALAGLTLEGHSRRESGTGNLDWDHFTLFSRDGQGTIVVPAGSSSTMLGKNLTTPPFKQTSDPTWVAGAVAGDRMRLNAVNEAAGMGPNAGTDLPDGRNRFTFAARLVAGAVMTAKVRVVNVTDNTETVSQAITAAKTTYVLSFDAVAGKLYQGEVVITAYTSGYLDVTSINQDFIPSLALNEQARSDPERNAVDRLDTSGNVTGYLENEGELPLILQPGTNIVAFRFDEIPLVFYDEPENKRTRTPTVTLTYSPRYAL